MEGLAPREVVVLPPPTLHATAENEHSAQSSEVEMIPLKAKASGKKVTSATSRKDRDVRRRRRLTRHEHNILEQAWEDNANWSKNTVNELTKRLGISRTKLYKWTWDRRKKDDAKTQ